MLIEDDATASLLVQFLEDKQFFRGTASDLLRALCSMAPAHDLPQLPKGPRALSAHLNRFVIPLERMGIVLERERGIRAGPRAPVGDPLHPWVAARRDRNGGVLMPAVALLAFLRRSGATVTLTPENQVGVEAPRGLLDGALRAAIRADREDLLALLQAEESSSILDGEPASFASDPSAPATHGQRIPDAADAKDAGSAK